MSQTIRFDGFRGLNTTLAVPGSGYASEAYNVRLDDGAISPRWGYRNLCLKTYGFDNSTPQVYGWKYAIGYNDSYVAARYWLGVFYSNSAARPYQIDPSTFVRTEIKNGATALSLSASRYEIASFYDRSYWINPADSASPYYNVIGTATSFVSLRGDYVAPTGVSSAAADTPDFDTVVINPAAHTVDGVVATAVALSGGPDYFLYADITNANVTGRGTVTITIPAGAASASRDWSKTNMLGVVFTTFNLNSPMRFDLPGIQITVINASGTRIPAILSGGDQEQRPDGSVQFFFDESTSSSRSDIRGIEIQYQITTAPGGGAGDNVIAWSIGRGYTDTRALAGIRDGGSLKYGVTYYNSVSGVEGPMTEVLLSVDPQGSYRNGQLPTRFGSPTQPDISRGATINFAASADAAVDVARIYYQAGDGYYHLMGSPPDAAGSFLVYQTETQALALPTYQPIQLDGGRLKGGFPFRSWMVWLYKGGKTNVRHSRVGSPTLLAQSTDETGDAARGADFTLADGFNDEPIGGTQAGTACFILGSKGVYSQIGDSPSGMSPTRKLPYSKGCAGPDAFAAVSVGGVMGLAYVDVDGEGLWFYGHDMAFAGDSGSRPVELSALVRGDFATWLRDGQIADFGRLDLDQIQVTQTVDDDDIWVTLGSRAMVYKKPSLNDGNRHWVRHDYALSHPDGPLAYGSVTTSGSTAGSFTSSARGGSGANWNTGSFTNDPTDGGYAEVTCPSGTYSNYFDITGIKPLTGLPPGATLTSVLIRIWWLETGAGVGQDSDVRVLLDGAPYGSNLAVPTTIPTSLGTFDYTVSFGAMGLSPEDINLGRLGLRISVAGSGGANAFVRVGAIQPVVVATQYTDPTEVVTPWCGDFLDVTTSLNPGFTKRPYSGIPGDGQDIWDVAEASTQTGSVWVKGLRPGIAIPMDAQISSIKVRVYAYGGTEDGGREITETTVQVYKDNTLTGSNLATSTKIGFANSDPREYTVDASLWTAREIMSGNFGFLVRYTGGASGNDRKVYVEALEMQVTFLVGDAEFGVSAGVGYRFLKCRSDLRQLWGVRYTGQVDELGWDSTWNRNIDGEYRDGGYVMPAGQYTTGKAVTRRSVVVRGQVIRNGDFSGETMSISTNEFSVAMARTVAANGWALFGSTGRGEWVETGISVSESNPGILAMEITTRQLGENR